MMRRMSHAKPVICSSARAHSAASSGATWHQRILCQSHVLPDAGGYSLSWGGRTSSPMPVSVMVGANMIHWATSRIHTCKAHAEALPHRSRSACRKAEGFHQF